MPPALSPPEAPPARRPRRPAQLSDAVAGVSATGPQAATAADAPQAAAAADAPQAAAAADAPQAAAAADAARAWLDAARPKPSAPAPIPPAKVLRGPLLAKPAPPRDTGQHAASRRDTPQRPAPQRPAPHQSAPHQSAPHQPPMRRPALARLSVWLGLVPFAAFAMLFLVLPALSVVIGAFRDPQGGLTLDNLAGLGQPRIVGALWLSVRLSLVTALIGCAAGFALAAAVTRGGLPPALRGPLMSFSGVAANFAGVPLAFAFIATLGRLGFVTLLARDWFGINLYASGFNLLSFWGLVLTYLYFQIPLMVLVITPALDGLRPEWREAAESLGASPLTYWRLVLLPILWPAVLGTLALLFANAFGAVATAMALTGSSLSLLPIVLFAQIRGDVLQDPGLGYAIAFGMIVLTGVASAVSILLRARAERWLK